MAKSFVFVCSVLLLSAVPAFAQRVAFAPEHLCESVECTEKMLSVLKAFSGAQMPAQDVATLGSGECFFLHPSYNSVDTHYGLLLMENQNGTPMYSGVFSFSSLTNPFSAFNLEQSREYLKKNGDNSAPLIFERDMARAKFYTPAGSIEYWIRQSRDEQEYILLGRWVFPKAGVDGRTFCRMRRQVLPQ